MGALKDEQTQQDAREAEAPKFGDRSQLGPAVHAINQQRIAKLGRLPLSRLLDHFDHAVKVAGVDHVGLGSDFDGADDQFPEGMEDISKIPNLVRDLMERGYSDEDILKILGQHFACHARSRACSWGRRSARQGFHHSLRRQLH